jgi:type IV secretory pathway TrbF-like protein
MATNPLEAFSYQEREYFTDEYERLALAARNWQIAFLIAAGTAFIAVVALGWLAMHSRLIPYVVNVDRQGYALAAPGALVEAEPFAGQDRLIRYELAGFIRAAREVIGDPLAQAAAIDRVRARTGDTAGRYITHWYQDNDGGHDPYRIARHARVTVTIDSILRETPGTVLGRFDAAQHADVALSPATANVSTWEVRWTEQNWNLSGDPGAQTHWEAELTVTLAPPAELEGAAAENPLGFTVEEISWTQGR